MIFVANIHVYVRYFPNALSAMYRNYVPTFTALKAALLEREKEEVRPALALSLS